MDNELCKCGKVGKISCPNDERCGDHNTQLPADPKWKLILHEQCEDAYFEITNGTISICANAGYVGEAEDEEDAIFKKVADALNNSGIDFHSENKLELAQHIEIQKLGYETDALKAKCERYEAALNKVKKCLSDIDFPATNEVVAIANEALSAGDGEKEVNDEVLNFIRDVAKNWDCDEDGHKYNTGCRKCSASELLYDLIKSQKENQQ